MVKRLHTLIMLAGLIALPLLGYVATYGITYAFVMSQSETFYYALAALLVTLIFLVVPYWMLKLLMHVAHSMNPKEKIFHLSDIPKDQHELDISDD